MTTPALERLHQLYPEAVIDLVCDARSKILFEHCAYRGDIFLKEKKQGKKGLFKLVRLLRKKRYDLVVDLRTDGLAYLLRGQETINQVWPYALWTSCRRRPDIHHRPNQCRETYSANKNMAGQDPY